MLQARRTTPRAGQRDPYYCPERDLAHIGPFLIAQALGTLDEIAQDEWMQKLMTEAGVGVEEAHDAAKKLALAMREVIQLKTPAEALEKSGFSAIHPAIQCMFFSQLGKVMLAAVWSGVKDTAMPETSAPMPMEDMLNMVEEFQATYNKPKPVDSLTGSLL